LGLGATWDLSPTDLSLCLRKNKRSRAGNSTSPSGPATEGRRRRRGGRPCGWDNAYPCGDIAGGHGWSEAEGVENRGAGRAREGTRVARMELVTNTGNYVGHTAPYPRAPVPVLRALQSLIDSDLYVRHKLNDSHELVIKRNFELEQ